MLTQTQMPLTAFLLIRAWLALPALIFILARTALPTLWKRSLEPRKGAVLNTKMADF
tara:strand:- start:515 stop:685 length:171 start_codon:yes stop_codon:yes gene_type:complete